MIQENIYEYIKAEENAFDTQDVRIGDNWNWNMKKHLQTIFHLKNSQFFTGENNWLRPFRNVMKAILNLSYWSEDIEVKDIVFYIENRNDRVLSFLVKKYHDDVYVKENDIDTLLDDITQSDVDYGGVLVQKGEGKPEVLPLTSLAFCDQTDILGGPIGFKFNFSPSKLRQMKSKGWGDPANGANISIDELITQAEATKDPNGKSNQAENQVTGKNIEVYIVRGDFPEHYLEDNDNMEDYSRQIHIVGFYTNKEDKKEGVTLFRKAEKDDMVKFHTSEKIDGRALGGSPAEDTLHSQVWTNFLEIHKMGMLEAGSKVLPWTDDDAFADRNNLQDMENLEMSTVAEGRQIGLIPTIEPAKIQLFEGGINSWFEQAQLIGSAQDPLLGKEPVSGTTFRGQTQTLQTGRGIHDRRRGQRAKYVEELYRWDIIPRMTKEILKGKEFLATLTPDEMKWVSERLIDSQVNKKIKDLILSGEVVTPEMQELFKEEAREEFSKGGNKRLFKILGDEFKDVEIKMGINVAGKQKNLALMSDKVLSILEIAFSNPQGFQQVMQVPGMASSFNDVLEFSGMSQVDFSNIANLPAPQEPQPQQGVQVPQSLAPKQPQNA